MSRDETLESLKAKLEERQCRVRDNRGIIERVYQARGLPIGIYRCKVIMEDNKVRYFDIGEVDAF